MPNLMITKPESPIDDFSSIIVKLEGKGPAGIDWWGSYEHRCITRILIERVGEMEARIRHLELAPPVPASPLSQPALDPMEEALVFSDVL